MWKSIYLAVLSWFWRSLRFLVTVNFSCARRRNHRLSEAESVLVGFEQSHKQYIADFRASFDALAQRDPKLHEMIESLESTLVNLDAVDPSTRFLALSALDFFHSEGGLDLLGKRLEAIILSDHVNAIPAACKTLHRYCPNYYVDHPERKVEIARRLAALSLDLEQAKPKLVGANVF